MTSPASAPRYPRSLGAGAGLLALALLAGLVGGGLWGVLRPTYTVEFTDGGAVVDPASAGRNVEFAALGSLAVVGAVLGVLLAAAAWRQTRKGELSGGVGSLLWLIVCAFASSWTAYVTGESLVRALHGMPVEPGGGHPSGVFELAPPVDPQVACLVAPFFAAAMYWLTICLLVTSPGVTSPATTPRTAPQPAS